MRILITGGTGFIGRPLIAALLASGHQLAVLARSTKRAAGVLPPNVEVLESLAGQTAIDAVINLAGENLADGRWTAARKQAFRSSRISTTQAVLDWMRRLDVKPAVLISGSAIGYYGLHGAGDVTEQEPAADDFVGTLCADWEAKAMEAEALGVRVCRVRIGVVLGAEGGALAKMLPPFRFGLGGRMGDGRQWMSWIHRADLVDLICWLLTNDKARGAFNGTAPEPVTNEQFSRALGAALHRPARLPMPARLLKIMLGEMADLLLTGRRVLPEHAQKAGFGFRYPTLQRALHDIIGD